MSWLESPRLESRGDGLPNSHFATIRFSRTQVKTNVRHSRTSNMLRRLMSRRAGQAYPIDDGWRRMVERKLKSKQMSRADLARAAGCSPSVISELLNGDAKESIYVPEIHFALDISPPPTSLLPGDTEELLALWEKLDDLGKVRLLERAAALVEEKKRS